MVQCSGEHAYSEKHHMITFYILTLKLPYPGFGKTKTVKFDLVHHTAEA